MLSNHGRSYWHRVMQQTLTDQQRTVFVIEDDVRQIKWIKLTVEQDGTRVVPVKIDRAAIEQAIVEASDRDVFLIDILLNSDLDGLGVTEILADANFSGSIVFVSGTGAEYLPVAQRLAEARGLTVNAVIEKPLLPHRLRASISGKSTNPS